MIAQLALHIGALVLIALVGIVLERRVLRTRPLVSVPGWAATLLSGSALIGPFFLVWEESLTVPLVDDLIAALALSCVGWLAAGRLFGIGARAGTC